MQFFFYSVKIGKAFEENYNNAGTVQQHNLLIGEGDITEPVMNISIRLAVRMAVYPMRLVAISVLPYE